MAEVQGRLTPAKGKEFANALGPYLTTANTIDITEARMKATGNGGKWSEEIPDHMEHSFAEIVSYISQSETLYLDDVAGSGTVGAPVPAVPTSGERAADRGYTHG